MEFISRAQQFFLPQDRANCTSSRLLPRRSLGFRQRYSLGEVLGKGTYSIVRKGYDLETKEKVAIKCIEEVDLNENDAASLKREVQMLKQLNHPNIINFKQFFHEQHERMYFIVTEHCAGGELFDAIVNKVFYSENTARRIIQTLACAVKHCHDRNIVHRDLKPENVLIRTRPTATGDFDVTDLKIADFGFAKYLQRNVGLTTICGSPIYVAPEIISKQEYGKGVDIWSLGVIAYILLCGYPPFNDSNTENLFRKIKSGRFEFNPQHWSAISVNAKDLILKMLTVDPRVRYDIDDVLQHPWLHTKYNMTKRVTFDAATLKTHASSDNSTISFNSLDTTATSVSTDSQQVSVSETEEAHNSNQETKTENLTDTAPAFTPIKTKTYKTNRSLSQHIPISIKEHIVSEQQQQQIQSISSPTVNININTNQKNLVPAVKNLRELQAKQRWKVSLAAVKVAAKFSKLSLSSRSSSSASNSNSNFAK